MNSAVLRPGPESGAARDRAAPPTQAQAPQVSVVMPVRNGAAFIGAAVDSVLAQSLASLELLVIDDASTDDTAALVQARRDPRVRLLRNEKRAGVSASRNRGIEAAHAPFIAFLDADDVAYPQRLELQLRYLESHPAVAVLGSHVDYIDGEGRLLFAEPVGARPCEPGALRRELLRRACILPSSAMARRAALQQAGAFSTQLDFAEDHDLWCRIALTADLAVLPDRLVAYRHHKGQATLRKIRAAHQGTVDCTGRARAAFVAAGLVKPAELPTAPSLWGHLRGRAGTLSESYVQWSQLHGWALDEPRRAVTLAVVAVVVGPLSAAAWRLLAANLLGIVVPRSVFATAAWYRQRLRTWAGGHKSK